MSNFDLDSIRIWGAVHSQPLSQFISYDSDFGLICYTLWRYAFMFPDVGVDPEGRERVLVMGA